MLTTALTLKQHFTYLQNISFLSANSICLCMSYMYVYVFMSVQLFFETVCFINPGASCFSEADYTPCYRNHPAASTGVVCYHARPTFYMDIGDLNSGPCACITSSLPTELFSFSQLCCLWTFQFCLLCGS